MTAISSKTTLMTVKEVAKWLRMKPSTIYGWAARNRIPCIRIGGRIRFVERDVLLWLEARKEGR